MTHDPSSQWPPQGHAPHPHGQQPYGQPQPGQPYAQPQPGQPYAQPQPGQPYGQPHPGQPHPGAYGQPQPGQPYGQPHPGQPYPGQPYPGQPHPGQPYPGQPGFQHPGGPWAQVPQYQAPPKPASNGVFKIIGGVVLTLIMGSALFQNAHEGFDSAEGFFTTAIFCAFLGGSLLLLLSGVSAAAKKTLPKGLTLGLPIGAALLFLGAGPFISSAYCKMDEAQRWDELNSAMDSDPLFFSGRWRIEYESQVDAKFRRPEWHARFMLARVKENIDVKDAVSLRAILKEIADSPDPSLYTDAEKAASEEFGKYYDAAKAKMYAPALADGGAREFPVDEQLRGAFATILDHLTHTPEANVYVAFRNTVELVEPEGTDELLKMYQSDPGAKAAFPDGAPVIDPQASFSPAYDSRRRQTFMAAMSESFGQVFDAELLTLVPLEEGASREGKIVIEVSSHIVRLPKFFFWEKEVPGGIPGEMRVAGLLFGIAVDWELHVYGPDGKELYAQPPARSEPAGNVSVNTQPGDPDWGMYSVLMDSAYYNYSRQVTGMFGLVPPAERTVFGYQGI